MKTLLFTLSMAMIALGSFAIQPAYAHCGTCEASEKSHQMKPCEKCLKAGKPCKCGNKAQKPCEKTLCEKQPCTKCLEAGKPCKCSAKKAAHDHGDKPCKICDQHEKRWQMEKDMSKGWQEKTEKGTYHVIKKKPLTSPYND